MASPDLGPKLAYLVSHMGDQNLVNISTLESPFLDQSFKAAQAQGHAIPSIQVQMATMALSAIRDYTTAFGDSDATIKFFRQSNLKSLLALLKAAHQLDSKSLMDEAYTNLCVKFLGAPPKYASEDNLEVLNDIKNFFLQREYYV